MSVPIPRLSITELHSAVANWNGMHPIGTKVLVTLDDGTAVETVTISEAWIMGGHSAVIKLGKISGAYSLSRVKAVRRKS